MNDITALIAKRKELDALLAQAKAKVVEEIRLAVTEFDIKTVDIFSKRAKRSEGKVALVDPQTGRTWSGRGRRPSWYDRGVKP